MSQRLTPDDSSFERLLAAALVLQRGHEQEPQNCRLAPDETLAVPPETHAKLYSGSEHDAISARLMAALTKLSKTAEAGVNQGTDLGCATTLNGIEQLILPLETQAGNHEPARHGTSFGLLTREMGTVSEPGFATVDTSRRRAPVAATEQTRTARPVMDKVTAAAEEEAATPEGQETSGNNTREFFGTARQSWISWPVAREKWELLTESVGRCAWPAFHALRLASSTAISADRYRKQLRPEAQSPWRSALESSSQELRGASKCSPLSGLPKRALGESWRHALPDGAKNRLASLARCRVKACVTFGSEFTSSQRRAVKKAATPFVVLLIMAAFTLTQVWPRGHFLTVAAVSRMNHPSDEDMVRKAVQFRPTPPDQVSHMQVTDRVVLSFVEGLSRYEIPALRRQAEYGDGFAAFVMGMVYETGHFVPQSCTKAAAWVTSSANAGNAAAQYNLGLRYRNGDGVPANGDEAEKWLRKAAHQRYSNAHVGAGATTG
jgi:hypothetical protein